MAFISILIISVDIFLVITYFGVFIYLLYIYKSWNEPTTGSWTVGSLLSALALTAHGLSVIQSSINANSADNLFRIAMILSFVSFWFWAGAHLIARRNILDLFLIVMLTLPLGFILPFIVNRLEVLTIGGVITEDYTAGFTLFDALFFLFFGVIYLILARDSHLIYNASIKQKDSNPGKSIAITHLLAWQFWAVGTAAIRYISKLTSLSLIFTLPYIFLLVPLLTLGSRPFDWAREGHEPIFLLLIDPHGTLTYSWMANKSSPLLLEGSTIATINSMFKNLIKEEVKSMVINFSNATLYTQSSNNYLSLLLTTGAHKSFEQLLGRIHKILVTNVIKQSEFGLPGYKIPVELQWLISQLLPDNSFLDFSDENSNLIKKMLLKSGIRI